MPRKNFVFIFFKDEQYKSPSPYLLEYVRFRHSGIPQHNVLSVQEAIAIMLKELKPEDVIGEVHLYSHTDPRFYFVGRLRVRDTYEGIPHTEVHNFQSTDKKARSLSKFSNGQTVVYIHGCAIGKSLDATRYWRDLFGGQKGKGVAPMLFQHFTLSTPILRAIWGKGKANAYEQEIRHTNDITEFINTAVAKARKAKRKLSPQAKTILEQNVNLDFDRWLMDNYDLLNKGGMLPSSKRNLSEVQIKIWMRRILDTYSGIPGTFLHPKLQLGEYRGNARKRYKPVGIFPEDAKWKSKHRVEPPH